jgi:outer membrane lipoprotein-sorting protein
MNSPVIARVFIVVIGASALSAPAWASPSGDPSALLDRIDKAGAAFRGMSAKLRRVSHTAVINEDNVDSGTILLKRVHARDLRMLIDLTEPDPKSVAFQGHIVEIYYPKAATVQEIDVGKGKDRELLEQFFLLGFGTSRADLEANYHLRLVGPDTVGGQKTELLELIPKSKEVLGHLPKLEMWMAENGYPIQQKFYLPGGDYQLATYSDIKINPPIAESDLKLRLPKNVKREYPQR